MFRKIMRRVGALTLAMVMLFSAGTVGKAASTGEPETGISVVEMLETGLSSLGIGGIQPASLYTATLTTLLEIDSSGESYMAGDVSGYPGVYRIYIHLVLQREKNDGSWTKVAEVSRTFYDRFAVLSDTRKVTTRGRYRAKATYTVSTASGSETITKYSNINVY